MKLPVLIKWKLIRTRLFIGHLKPRAFVLPFIILALTVSALVLSYQLFKTNVFWITWDSAFGNAFQYCEYNYMQSIIRQPSNTWSNLAYLVVSLIIITVAVNDLKHVKERYTSENFLVRHPIFSFLFGLTTLYLFVGSFMFHASLTEFFQKLDQTAMYFLVWLLILFNGYKMWPHVKFKGVWYSTHFLFVFLHIVGCFFIYEYLFGYNINFVFPLMVLIMFISTLIYLKFFEKNAYFLNYMVASLAILILAGTIWILDRKHVLCNPDSIWQGHAFWHVLTAISILFVYMYYRTGIAPIGAKYRTELEMQVS